MKTRVFLSVDEYCDFAQKHKVYGADAVKLKKKLERENRIPEPKISKNIKRVLPVYAGDGIRASEKGF